MAVAHYVIGIDLGTTNCTLSLKATDPNSELRTLAILQQTALDTIQPLSMLPSFLYYALPEEQSAGAPQICVGTFARERGAEVPGRVVSSAKSWLCYSGVDRREDLLPASSDDPEAKISPVNACAQLLQTLKESWDTEHPEAPFVQQQILVTVPASFDPSARQLVQEAAAQVGYPDIVLLEEPQAALYAWLHQHDASWRQQLAIGDTILVVDIGGGTTDFSLIQVEDEGGELALRRLAVGAHLLLGGDNLDLALAYHINNKLDEQGHTLDTWQMQSLIHSCRAAKEQLLSGSQAPASVELSIRKRSSRLIGGTLTTTLTLDEVNAIVFDGFLPIVPPTERSESERRLGMQQVGLPYAQDPRMTCQLAKFLAMTGETESDSMERFVVPTAVLFNGGTLKSESIRQRFVDQLNQWASDLGRQSVKVLPNPDLDFAVSRGAVAYGFARMGNAIRIRGGTSHSYFIGVEEAVPAVPGVPTPLTAVCVVPFGMEEGSEQTLQGHEFALVLGQPATFRFFSCSAPKLSDDSEPVMGAPVRSWRRELTELHPIETMLDKGPTDGNTVRVTLHAKVTETGVLELWCIAADGRRWKLEFDVRQPAQK